MNVASLIGTRDGVNWESLSAGPASQVLGDFRGQAFAGFSKVVYLDSRGTRKRRKGSPDAAKPAAKRGKKKA